MGSLLAGMKNDVNLKENLPKHESKGTTVADRPLNHVDKVKIKMYKPPTVGIAKAANFKLKASSRPKKLHLYVENLLIDTKVDFIEKSIERSSNNCVISRRYDLIRSVAAYVVVGAKDKLKALKADSWPEQNFCLTMETRLNRAEFVIS